MGFLDNFLGKNNDKKPASQPEKAKEKEALAWKAIDSEAMIDEMIATSHNKLVVLFKHSTRCGISRMVLNRFEAEANFDEEKVALYFLDLIRYRDVSNKIAERFRVRHQSPQVIVLENGEVIGDASHHAIDAEQISKHLEK